MTDKDKTPAGECCAMKLCPFTMGYYIGGGLYICWLHAIKTGVMAAIRKTKQRPVALRGFER